MNRNSAPVCPRRPVIFTIGCLHLCLLHGKEKIQPQYNIEYSHRLRCSDEERPTIQCMYNVSKFYYKFSEKLTCSSAMYFLIHFCKKTIVGHSLLLHLKFWHIQYYIVVGGWQHLWNPETCKFCSLLPSTV